MRRAGGSSLEEEGTAFNMEGAGRKGVGFLSRNEIAAVASPFLPFLGRGVAAGATAGAGAGADRSAAAASSEFAA